MNMLYNEYFSNDNIHSEIIEIQISNYKLQENVLVMSTDKIPQKRDATSMTITYNEYPGTENMCNGFH
jgi:hypothetical protein